MKKTRNRVALGTFPLSGVYNPIAPSDSKHLVGHFFELGGYYIDTAPMYGCGKIETLLGSVLTNKNRDDFYLISKCGKEIHPLTNSWESRATYKDIIDQCNSSLSRLKLDYIDLYLVHSPDKNTPFEETIQAMLDLQKIGKIKEIGVSNVTLEELKKYQKYAKIQFIQNRFSFINRSISDEFQEYLNEHKIQLIPYEILEIGQLTGSIIEEENFGSKDVRGTTSFFQGNPLQEIRSWVKNVIKPLAKKKGMTVAQLMIAWTLTKPQIQFALVGSTKKEYLSINLQTDSISLTKNLTEELELSYNTLTETIRSKYSMSIKDFRGLND
ncbi:hypothetical protein COY90_01525, partial [Candidatus Roizmanbacteria bacterium CG_4_10_14_0_8_um_filter_39_9]